jgi:hypothetical protein
MLPFCIPNKYYKDLYAKGHDISKKSLGFLPLYWNFFNLNKRLSSVVFIGSGTGLVPRYFVAKGKKLEPALDVTLIDACCPDAGWGGPWDKGGWIYDQSSFQKECARIRLYLCLSKDAFKIMDRSLCRYEMIFIDGDHSFEGILNDIGCFSKISRKIILHDYNLGSVKDAVREFLNENNSWGIHYVSEREAGVCFLMEDV